MAFENLGHGAGVNHEGDIVPLADLADSEGDFPELNDDIIEAASGAARRFVLDAGVVASNVIVDHEGVQRSYPHTAIAVIMAREAEKSRRGPENEATDAYAELGGGISSHREAAPSLALENVLDEDYEPWMLDVRLAVEQFGVVDFSPSELRAMKSEDFQKYSLYFYNFLQSIDMHANLIIGAEGRTDIDGGALRDRFGERAPEELNKYLNTLKWLKTDLEATGIPQMVRRELDAPATVHDNVVRRNKLLQQAATDKKRHGGQTVRVVKVKGKVRLERTLAV